PQFVELREQRGTPGSGSFLRSVVSGTLGVMTVVFFVWFALSPWLIDIIGHGFDPGRPDLVRTIFLCLFPYYFLSGINLLGHGALQAQKQFLPSAVAPLCTSLTTIGIVLLIGGNVRALAISVVLGSFFESLVLQWQLRKSGLTLKPGWLEGGDLLK